MAHSWRKGPRRLAVCITAALACIDAHDAQALVMGEARVRSPLGNPLDVRVPATLGAGESIDPTCFTLSTEASAVPRITGARISVERSAAATLLRIETARPINDPVVALGLVASCRGLTDVLEAAAVPRRPSFAVGGKSDGMDPAATGSERGLLELGKPKRTRR